jgi:hypothetical protein
MLTKRYMSCSAIIGTIQILKVNLHMVVCMRDFNALLALV